MLIIQCSYASDSRAPARAYCISTKRYRDDAVTVLVHHVGQHGISILPYQLSSLLTMLGPRALDCTPVRGSIDRPATGLIERIDIPLTRAGSPIHLWPSGGNYDTSKSSSV